MTDETVDQSPPAKAPVDIDAFVERWFAERIANTAATQAGAAVANVLIAAKDELKRRMKEEF